jgi:lipoprotein signal peptidase
MEPTPRTTAWWAVAAAIVFADQLTKTAASHAGLVAHNPAYALGVVGGPAPALVVGTLIVMAVFVGSLGRWATQLGVSPLFTAMIAGGTSANLIDRVRFGEVRDFVVTPWAIVNFADVTVFVGIVAFAVALMLRLHRLHIASYTVRFEIPKLRAIVVARGDG